MKKFRLFSIPYYCFLIFFVALPIILLVYRSLQDPSGHWTLANYLEYLSSKNYLIMTASSFFYAFLITLLTFLLAYPMAFFLSQSRRKDLWSLLLILPTWINLLLKIYAFIGILSRQGPINQLIESLGFSSQQFLFTNLAFVLVAVYIELPFMVIPIFNSIDEIPTSLLEASDDLGASQWTTLSRVVFPLSMNGIRSGVQTVFIPSLSLFMLTRLIGGNRVITLGTAVEQHFLVTQNWSMGATIGVVLLLVMSLVMWLTRSTSQEEGEAINE